MSTITADPAMQTVLSQVKDATEIRDANGKLLGVFTPKTEEAWLIDKAKELVDLKELERRKKEEHGKGIPTDELLRKLEALGSST